MSIPELLLLASLAENSVPDWMLEDIERRRRSQLSKPLKTCKCGNGFNYRGYICSQCFEEKKK